jgi:ABC-type phosphonate transport system ATPase subunit
MEDRRDIPSAIGLPVAEFLHQGQTVLLAALTSQLVETVLQIVHGQRHHDLAELRAGSLRQVRGLLRGTFGVFHRSGRSSS